MWCTIIVLYIILGLAALIYSSIENLGIGERLVCFVLFFCAAFTSLCAQSDMQIRCRMEHVRAIGKETLRWVLFLSVFNNMLNIYTFVLFNVLLWVWLVIEAARPSVYERRTYLD
jgi:hypothetical protein